MPKLYKSKSISRVSPIAIEILSYLYRNPEAADTLVGVARWWLLKNRIQNVTTEVKRALDELLDAKVLVRTCRISGQPIYTLNHRRSEQIQLLLSEASKEPDTASEGKTKKCQIKTSTHNSKTINHKTTKCHES